MFEVKGAYDILTSRKLTYEQKVMGLARAAENALDVLDIPARTAHFFETGAINDLFEGHAPYRPRYTMPDYETFIKNGSEFLNLAPPADLDELLNSLLILYHHVPSITGFPVYLGNLDHLLELFLDGYTDDAVKRKLKLFLTSLDRTITDSFCHANLGPEETRAGSLILEVEAELNNAVPNFTVKYDPSVTPDAFMEKAIVCSLACSNPAICNHTASSDLYACGYGISSCYNILPIGGGAYTLTRITLAKLVDEATSVDEFMNTLLPECLDCIGAYMNERSRFLVEQSGFFESSFLVQEGLLHRDRFIAMFGVTGLAECVNKLLGQQGYVYGKDNPANELGLCILDAIRERVESMHAVHSPLTSGRFVLHAQVGLDSDIGVTSGVRIPVGGEPEDFFSHLRHSAQYHPYFPAGVGDIFPIAPASKKNPAALLDVVKGAFREGVHYMSFYAADTDMVRITGYLVKRREMEKFECGEVVLQNTTQLGSPNYKVNRLADRMVRMI